MVGVPITSRALTSRLLLVAAVLAAMLVLVVGCGSDSDAPEETATSAQAKACSEVRAGIDDFNRGDYEGTVEHFTKAQPLARAYADISDSQTADDLREAVDYYADLAPDDYPESARSSDDFARNKEITLGQCAAEPDGVDT